MPSSQLNAAGSIILGLLALEGPKTSHELNELIDTSIGNFWNFPRSQIYAAPRRLAELGLVVEEQEEDGRRRRTFTITDAGRAALDEWLTSPAGRPELRDGGLLRLFFADLADPNTVVRLADEQHAAHTEQLAAYTAVVESGRTDKFLGASAALRLGVLYEQAESQFWSEIREQYLALADHADSAPPSS